MYNLMIDILASAYFMIFRALSDEDRKAIRDLEPKDFAPNSICGILSYFVRQCNATNLRFDSDQSLMKTLQMNIRKMLTEGDE